MRILYINPGLDFKRGGAVSAALQLANALSGRGVEIVIFAPRGNKENVGYTEKYSRIKVEFFKKGFFSNFWTGYSLPLTRELKQRVKEFDLIHIHEMWHYPNFAAYRMAKRAKKPFIVSVHGELTPKMLSYKALRKKVYYNFIQKKILDNASALHAITSNEAETLSNITSNKNIFCIPNGINAEEFNNVPNEDIFTDAFPEIEGKKVILFLGRIHPVKGLDLLARAFTEVLKKVPEALLVIAGSGSEEYKTDIVNILVSGDAIKSTIFTGMVQGSMKRAILRRADIFVLPSHSEVLGISTLEAMISEVPVIVTKKCNFPEIEKMSAGKIVDVNVQDLTEAIIELALDPKKRLEMGKNGKKLVEETYTLSSAANKMKKVYEKIIGKEDLGEMSLCRRV